MGREITFQLEEDGKTPVFLNLASVILGEVERGRLNPGDPLPGTRALAKSLRIHRNTVDAAYRELVLQGWLVTEPSRGTFVARDLPEVTPSRRTEAKTALQKAAAGPEAWTPPVLLVSDGAPDPRIVPRAELARAFRRALAAPSFLATRGYDDPGGSTQLRAALAGYLTSERGLTATGEGLIVTRGSQMALFLAAQAVFQPGEIIAAEDPGYPLAWSAFRAAGARVIGVPVDAQGLSVDHLAAIAEREPALRAVYVTPHHQYPTTVTMGAGRRLKLLDLARRLNLTIIEDDYDHEYRFDGRPVLPLAARANSGVDIIYIGSLSKLFAPGNPSRLRDDKSHSAAANDGNSSGDRPPGRSAVGARGRPPDRRWRPASACPQSPPHLSKTPGSTRRRNPPQIRRQDRLRFTSGGLAIWLRLTDGSDAGRWASRAASAGLAITAGCAFAIETSAVQSAFRFGYASLDEAELCRAVDLLMRSR